MRWEGKDGIRGISKETITAIEAGDECGLDRDGCSGGCEKWSDSAYMLKVELSSFRDGYY